MVVRLPLWLIWTLVVLGILAGALNMGLFVQTGKPVHLIVVGTAAMGTGIFAWATLWLRRPNRSSD